MLYAKIQLSGGLFTQPAPQAVLNLAGRSRTQTTDNYCIHSWMRTGRVSKHSNISNSLRSGVTKPGAPRLTPGVKP